ncbi:uncharacterized protein K452DRAFT_282097 [Aplosporella prunicola CBS 121167]|uniref:Zn(2)-C6 fungal-type domain-containing protein n=1 Tax=Aplosporella prunicola CBS 121167 TaxID=1176127 RepID=A0A6A6BSM4_9PEZI|nr:uncharacterized protein K452DRAFT_282097 [Aplosporella prunicola CBS 121167]KAF2147109.1 hypothetical protein K452DRAFT_282097 [Aplosporella prunicola CBS 121167]
MVYTGKPSRGCQTCKSRRIKCDEQRPTCGNCRKSKRHCPGFPDEFDLLFRNENVAVVRRVNKGSESKIVVPVNSVSPASEGTLSTESTSTNASSAPSVASYGSDSSGSNEVQLSDPNTTLLRVYMCLQGDKLPGGIRPSLENQATAFFFRNFILLPQQSEAMRGFVDLIVPYYGRASEQSPVQLATHAVALSAFGNFPGRGYIATEASKTYGRALRRVGKAIADPVEAKSDEVLLSIMLFALYEAITSTNDSVNSWTKHVDGAVTIAKLRGAKEFQSEDSRKVFQAVRSMTLTSAIQQCIPVEDFPGEGWDSIKNENAANRLTALSMDLPEIRARVRKLVTDGGSSAEKIAEAQDLMETVKKIDIRFQNWFKSLPETWSYKTVAYTHAVPDDIMNAHRWFGPVHAYEDVFTANIINDYRLARIFVQSIILGCASILAAELEDYDTMMCCADASLITQQQIDDICASVPYHMDFTLQGKGIESHEKRKAVEALGGYLLVWPVFVASNVEIIPSLQRSWLHGRLLYIGREFGLNQAQMLAMARQQVLSTPGINMQMPPIAQSEASIHLALLRRLGMAQQQSQSQGGTALDPPAPTSSAGALASAEQPLPGLVQPDSVPKTSNVVRIAGARMPNVVRITAGSSSLPPFQTARIIYGDSY